MKQRRTKYAVYGRDDDMLSAPTMFLGRYRWHWRARLRAWWFKLNNSHWAYAWIREEDVLSMILENRKAQQ